MVEIVDDENVILSITLIIATPFEINNHHNNNNSVMNKSAIYDTNWSLSWQNVSKVTALNCIFNKIIIY